MERILLTRLVGWLLTGVGSRRLEATSITGGLARVRRERGETNYFRSRCKIALNWKTNPLIGDHAGVAAPS